MKGLKLIEKGLEGFPKPSPALFVCCRPMLPGLGVHAQQEPVGPCPAPCSEENEDRASSSAGASAPAPPAAMSKVWGMAEGLGSRV